MESPADQPPPRIILLAGGPPGTAQSGGTAGSPGGPVTAELTVALRTGRRLICRDLAEAARAEARGIDRRALLIEAAPGQAAGLIAAGWPVLVDADAAGGGAAGAAAAGALCAWLGAAAVRTRYETAVRRAIDMTESIKGTRPLPGGGYGRS